MMVAQIHANLGWLREGGGVESGKSGHPDIGESEKPEFSRQHSEFSQAKCAETDSAAAAVYPAKEADESAFLIFLSRSVLENGFSSSTSPRISPRALMCSPA